jgi:hypothetical protein
MRKKNGLAKHPKPRRTAKTRDFAKTNGDNLPREGARMPRAELMLKLQIGLASSDRSVSLGDSETTMEEIALAGSAELYDQIAPKDGLDAILASLLIGCANATHNCFAEAAAWRSYPKVCDLNLRNGILGAKVTAEIIKQLDERRLSLHALRTPRECERAENQKFGGKIERRPQGQENMYAKFQMAANGKTPKTHSGKNGKVSGWL